MASFPGAVKTFTTKNDGAGNTIFAAHVNDLQDEVNAIEDGLRNGTAPLNSSNSTFTNLSVTGGSTVTGTLTVGGNSSLTGALHVAGNSTFGGTAIFSSVITAAQQPRFSGYSTTTQVITANSTSVLNLLTEDFDIGALHSTASNPSRVTIPAGSSGLYYCAGQTFYSLSGAASVGDRIRLYLRKTGADQVVSDQVVPSTVISAAGFSLAVAGLFALDAADYVELAAAAQTNAWLAGSATPVFATRLLVMKVA